MSDHKGCEGCRFLLKQDSGYSNWTVEYTSLDCLLDLNPKMPCAETWVTDPKLDPVLAVGETCPRFSEGVPVYFDVDGDVTAEDYKDDPEVYALLKQSVMEPECFRFDAEDLRKRDAALVRATLERAAEQMRESLPRSHRDYWARVDSAEFLRQLAEEVKG